MNIEQGISNYEVFLFFLCAVFTLVTKMEINGFVSHSNDSSFEIDLISMVLEIRSSQIFVSRNSFREMCILWIKSELDSAL